MKALPPKGASGITQPSVTIDGKTIVGEFVGPDPTRSPDLDPRDFVGADWGFDPSHVHVHMDHAADSAGYSMYRKYKNQFRRLGRL